MIIQILFISVLSFAQTSKEDFCKQKASDYTEFQACMAKAPDAKWKRVLKGAYKGWKSQQKARVNCTTIGNSTTCDEQ